MKLLLVKECGTNIYNGMQFLYVPEQHIEIAKSLVINPVVAEPESQLYSAVLNAVERYFSLYQRGYSPKNKAHAEFELARFSNYNLSLVYRRKLPYGDIGHTRRTAECWLVHTKQPELGSLYDPGLPPYIDTTKKNR